jgi:putative tryptophan/tyrosine transport system substrate-binding protein
MRRQHTAVLLAFLSIMGEAGHGFAQSSPPTVAVLRATGDESARVTLMFLEALRGIGHEDGRTFRFVEYSANNVIERLPSLAARIVADHPVVVVAMGPAAARALKDATTSIPIVAFTSFPVEAGLAASLARPGGNLTGVSLITTELDAKRLGLLAEFAPSAKRIAILRDRAVPADHLSDLGVAAQGAGIALDVFEVARPDEIGPAMRLAKSRGAQGLNVLASPMLNGSVEEIAGTARELGLPTVCQWREMAQAGCLLSYGPSFMEGYRLTAAQMDRVLRGADPAGLPILQPTHFELVINLKTAAAIGLVIPPSLLIRADEVIE